MHTSKISLPPIKQMLGDISGKKESSSGVYTYPLRSQNTQLIQHQQNELPMEYNNSDAYTFDSWHACLSPQNLSPGLVSAGSCQCATNRVEPTNALSISVPSSVNKYAYQYSHPPPSQSPQYHPHLQHYNIYHPHSNNNLHPNHPYSHHRPSHRHRRAYSASTFVHPSSYLQTSGPSMSSNQYQSGSPNRIWTPMATHPTLIDNGTGALYRGRARAHTTSGYLPTANLTSSPSPSHTKPSSFVDISPGIKPTPHEEQSSLQFNQQQQQQQRHRYHCPHCKKTFSRPSSLRIHIYSHTGEKPHVCPYFDCRRRFSVQSNMRRHIRVHTGSNSTVLSRGEHPSHLNDDHLDVSPAGPIYQQGSNSPSYYSTSNLMLHGH